MVDVSWLLGMRSVKKTRGWSERRTQLMRDCYGNGIVTGGRGYHENLPVAALALLFLLLRDERF